jgi:hypothetical protein
MSRVRVTPGAPFYYQYIQAVTRQLIALFLSQFFVQFVQLRVFLPDYLPVAQTLVPESQSSKRPAKSNLREIPRYFRTQLFPISSSSVPHDPDLSACVLNPQVTSGLPVRTKPPVRRTLRMRKKQGRRKTSWTICSRPENRSPLVPLALTDSRRIAGTNPQILCGERRRCPACFVRTAPAGQPASAEGRDGRLAVQVLFLVPHRR